MGSPETCPVCEDFAAACRHPAHYATPPAPADEGRAAIEREMAETMRVNAPADEAGAAEDHTSEARRGHGAEGPHRAVVEAARALLDGTRRDGCLYCVCGRLMTGNVAHQANCAWNRLDAALRGTKGGGEAPTPADPTNHAPAAASADGCTEPKDP